MGSITILHTEYIEKGCGARNECKSGAAQCSQYATCIDTKEGYDCECFEGSARAAGTDERPMEGG